MIFVIATLKTTPENLEALIDAARPCIAETGKEAGCISYDFHQSVSDPLSLVFVERWRDRDALEEHFKSPHLAAWRTAFTPLVVEKRVEIIAPEKVETL